MSENDQRQINEIITIDQSANLV
ncbi:uncharacterized protein METZ01_LOCUS470988 [marine metagenome]|uniref:Uncharacterized protein n=1 Tax=marine metagenome TaxID=408172 RepID=A0A383BE44_9ZZZZ